MLIISIDTKNRIIRIDTGLRVFNFDESKVKRDGKGQFACKDGGSGGKTAGELYGEEFKALKGKDAIGKIMQEKRGHVKGAFMRPDIGDIDLIWGDENRGLCHIIKRRKKEKQPLKKLLDSLTEVVEKGDLSVADKNRLQIKYKGKRAIIEPHFCGKKLQMLFTAYYE